MLSWSDMDTQEKPVQRTLSGRPKRKRCKNCSALFPFTKPNREFCSDNCRKDFHRNGGSHMKVLQTIWKELPGLIREAFRKPPKELLDAVISEIARRAEEQRRARANGSALPLHRASSAP